ncbi:uncharacterized protein LOC129591295 [Paramacrobiotus metropolitanus]|uniref:uncharacterized protein LOC129591295 n=1 Tax=Paramacrobiotus metropolitanus TaxID=2943436 RepID=UPI002445F703|nr:uncharacterized protein LOC129591295 [Paramacrobiotus metropolitanus]
MGTSMPPLKRLAGHSATATAALPDLGDDHKVTVNVGAGNTLWVWDPADAIHVQKVYRIQGVLTGCFPKVPMQDTFASLPLRLMPEEAAYLRDRGRAVFVSEEPLARSLPTLLDRGHFDAMRHEQFQQQADLFTILRESHTDVHKDELLKRFEEEQSRAMEQEGRPSLRDREELWRTERERWLGKPIEDIRHVFNMELPTRSWRVGQSLIHLPEISFQYPTNDKESAACVVFTALMDAGFSVTSGANYGADFLAFRGDPHVVYSSYMVKVVREKEEFKLDEYLRLGRVATTAKKAILWAIVIDNNSQVRFCCSKWALMK